MKRIVATIVSLVLTFLPFEALATNTYTTSLAKASSQEFTGGDIIDGLSAFTIEQWVKPASVNTGDLMHITSKMTSTAGTQVWRLVFSDDDANGVWDTIYWQMRPSGGGTFNSCNSAASTFSTGTWYHISVTWDGAASLGSRCKIYVNGSPVTVAADNTTATMNDSAVAFEVGYQNGAPASRYYDGQIDDIRSWNIARTSSDISTTYNCKISNTTTGLTHNWLFENNATDEVSGGVTLTAVNSPTYQNSSLPYTDDCGGGAIVAATSTTLKVFNTTLKVTNGTLIIH
jgi:hypothetical protein